MNKVLIVAAAVVALAVPASAAASTLPYLEQDPVYKLAEHSRHETAKNAIGNIR